MTCSTSRAGPPTKITRDPDSASARLPRTGVSSSPVPGGSADASQATAAGPTVDMSSTVSGGRAPAAIPSCPSVTDRSACGSLSIVINTPARAAASAGVAAATAPRLASGATFPGDLFQTVTSCPASRSRAAMRLPIAPSPTTATAVIPAPSGRRDMRPPRPVDPSEAAARRRRASCPGSGPGCVAVLSRSPAASLLRHRPALRGIAGPHGREFTESRFGKRTVPRPVCRRGIER